jgi:regulator of sirC expression with transglutaminase-like and TPR domain
MTPAGDRFRNLVAGPEDALALDEACLLIAAHQYPDLGIDAYLTRLDELASGCQAPTLAAIAEHLYSQLGFAGNDDAYYDARNSFLNDVLDRRTGIPITLSIVVIEVGRRLGIPLYGVGMPGHFLVGSAAGYFDAFAGVHLDAAGCAARFTAVRPDTPFDPSFLEPTGRRAIVSRILANLQGILFSTDLRDARWVVDLRRAIPDQTVAERRRIVQALAALGRFDAAADELMRMRAEVPEELADRFEREARRLRARTN